MPEKNQTERRLLKEANEDLFLRVVRALRGVFDPELPVNVYDLGLIYKLEIDDGNWIHLQMTLTAPNCPEAEYIPGNIQRAVQGVEGVGGVDIELVFDPPWSRENMSTAAQLALGLI